MGRLPPKECQVRLTFDLRPKTEVFIFYHDDVAEPR